MRIFNYIVVFLLLCVVSTSCSKEQVEESTDVVILYTTDVHGSVLPYDFNRKRPAASSLANASTYIKQMREEYGKDKVLLFDGGDYYQGTPAMYFYNYRSPYTNHIVSDVSNYLRYNALVYGNHDMEIGEEGMAKIDKELVMPRLGGNVVDTRLNRSMFRSYKIFNVNGFKIGLFGLITPETYEQVPKSLIPHMEFDELLESTQKWIHNIKNNQNVDYIVGILHTGLTNFEFIQKSDSIQEGLKYLAESLQDIDLLLLGHDHRVNQLKVPTKDNDTLYILQPGPDGEDLGRVNISLKRNINKLEKQTETEIVHLKDIELDKEYLDRFGYAVDTVNAFLDKSLGVLDEEFDLVNSLYKQTNSMDFIHQVQMDITGAEISLTSTLSTFHNLPVGPITLRTLFTLYKYDNQIHKMWMNGYDIKNYLEYGYDRQFATMNNNHGHLLAFKFDNNGKMLVGRWGPELLTPQYNYSSAGGINYVVDITKPLGQRVNIISMADGSPFYYNRLYTVAINSYQAAGGGGFITKGLNWTKEDIAYHTLSETPNTFTYYMSEYISKHQHITTKPIGTWKVIPEGFADTVGPKDVQMLLPYIAK